MQKEENLTKEEMKEKIIDFVEKNNSDETFLKAFYEFLHGFITLHEKFTEK